ncbi:MAG: trimethylamine methyltransferase family protein, partial [Gammaproteobacteria bacterium]
AATPGRRARRDRQRPQAEAPAFLRRRIPTYEMLSEEGLRALEHQAEQLLAEIGVEFRGDDEALAMWRRAGAPVEGQRVRFEPGMLGEIVRTAPATFVQHARDPRHHVGNRVFA